MKTYFKTIKVISLIFWKKSFSDKRLLFRILYLLVFFRVLIFLPFKAISHFLGETGRESSTSVLHIHDEYVRTIARYIKTMSRFMPWKSTCLVQAAAGKILMNRKKIDSTVYFGVKKDNKNKLQAHAWLRVGQDIILGGENASEFVVVSMFS